MPKADPQNALSSFTAGWALFTLNGRWLNRPIYVDDQGFVKVRLEYGDDKPEPAPEAEEQGDPKA